jgi:adenylate kinase family enzyme
VKKKDLQNIVRSNAWIIEGVHYEWVLPSFQQAELIIYLDTPYSIRTYRIIKRFVRQKFGLEQANYQPTFNIFWKMSQWNSFFERESKPKILNIVSQYEDKFIIVKNDDEIKTYFKMRWR